MVKWRPLRVSAVYLLHIFARLCNRWISVRLALLGAIINVFTGVIILQNIETMNASVAGFCLSFVLMFTDQVCLYSFTDLETKFRDTDKLSFCLGVLGDPKIHKFGNEFQRN